MSVERQLMMSSGGVQQYTISNSLRFRASASAYLSRTYGTPTNAQKGTLSFWLKRGAIGTDQELMGAGTSSYDQFQFTSDQIRLVLNAASDGNLKTTSVFRDPSAWYHIVLSIDTTLATAANRAVIYVNGTSQPLTITTNVTQNLNPKLFTNVIHYIGCYAGGTTTNNLDGYLTEINFIDGQALTPSSFGETSSTTGVWIPKKYTGSYGTNGFYLNFSNNTSTTALGYDTSGNSNNWTPNNFSLTTGSTYDSMIDSPTSYASGTNNVGNYCVLNPNDKQTNSVLSDGNLTATGTNSGGAASFGLTSGKWYWEVTLIDPYLTNLWGIHGVSSGVANSYIAGYTGYPVGAGVYATTVGGAGGGGTYANGSAVTAFTTWANSDVIGFAFDASALTLDVYRNNSKIGSTLTVPSGAIYPSYDLNGFSIDTSTTAYNFGQRPFAYTPPSGYNALNTYNLSTPSIVDGSKQFAASLYTGTGSSLGVSGANFTPGMVWIKSRSAATDHALYDVIRGTQARLESNTTDAEVTSDNGVTAFNSTGFTVGTLAQVNTSSATYVGWQWKANGAGVTNTDGTITSSVSANQTAGFSVVTYTGNGVTTATVGHGLGVAPSMVIVKARALTTDWQVYLALLGPNYTMQLNATGGPANYSSYWYNGGTSSTFGVNGTYSGINGNGSTYVAYCFAAIPGYSAFGSYTGNGSADGPFVYCGFRPRYLLVKRTDSIGAWEIYDTSRSPYNVTGAKDLQADSSAAEGASGISVGYDILSNGFKNRDTTSYLNASGGTYIYAAFAENPFKYSLAR